MAGAEAAEGEARKRLRAPARLATQTKRLPVGAAWRSMVKGALRACCRVKVWAGAKGARLSRASRRALRGMGMIVVELLGKSKGKSERRSPSGMATRTAKAHHRATKKP